MATQGEGTSAITDSVYFSFMTSDEVRRLSFKKITNPVLLDSLLRPVEGGLYDTALGSIDDGQLCKSCNQRSWQCPGHCGHIDMVLPIYNPLLFHVLFALLQKTCFFCYHFRINRNKVQAYINKLYLIRKGDIVGFGNLEKSVIGDKENIVHDNFVNVDARDSISKEWTSLQHSMARAVSDEFMKEKKKGCDRCGAKNPKISCPTFGWFQMCPMDNADARANTIKGLKLDESLTVEVEQDSERHTSDDGSVELPDLAMSLPEEGKEKLPTEFLKQNKLFGRPLLPTEVKLLLQRLWANEEDLCSLIFDIQHRNLPISGENKNYSMFFIEALLVPPCRLRPLCKSNGMVMIHPQSVLLSKVINFNISLGTACMNSSERPKLVSRWMDLQLAVNVLFDCRRAIKQSDKMVDGICQLLEKKDGIFRQKMMGKRVNFACRSVISPDPYLAVNEIGIPPYFALKLTYPEKVTLWNVTKLRNAIINGPELHPGATHYMDKSAIMKLPPSSKSRISISRKLPSSRGVAANHNKSLESEFEGKVVYRHLQDGDVVLVNRQPTLHKPSMMAHVVRVLKGEKTIRMHYANCSTYNADFDGDEINVHFPQDEISRAEAYHIADANKQFVVPSSGNPIRGLIQDHVISAVLLTKKDTFFNREEYHQLVYASCVSVDATRTFSGGFGKKICLISSDDEIIPVLPAIWKPKPMWTGKQVITTILNHITRGNPPFTIKKAGKIPSDYFGMSSRENKLHILKNELLHGVIDKDQFGKHGLVHTVEELYGSDMAGILLSIFSRLFTVYLQMHGFTCGVDDLLVYPHSDHERKISLDRSDQIGEDVHADFIDCKNDDAGPMKLQLEIEKVMRGKGESATIILDGMMSNALRHLTSEVNNQLIPRGLMKPFPKNCLSLMTTSGAKGRLLNFEQISSLLGQQDLEGKRVPRMVSGKTLPCFHPWDSSSRSGGFVGDRFLSGLRPQEYYFHCMAGRDGLVDTAIKTSRSGYLQRCLVKNLEALKVCYDHTVRDVDGSVVQFCYGEDGVDVQKTSFITQFKAFSNNQSILLDKLSGQVEDANTANFNYYINELPDELEKKAKDFFDGLALKKRESLNLKEQKKFMKLIKLKYLSSLAQPGEAVGILAAQSVGEPSTQMTLNTFHLAGRGEMNVTLGIPRLQEILQRASEKILTPVMTCPLQKGRTRDDAEQLAAKLRKVSVFDVIESLDVTNLISSRDGLPYIIYKLKIKLYDPEFYPPHADISLEDCLDTLKAPFIREMEDLIYKHLHTLSKINTMKIVADREHVFRNMTDVNEYVSNSEQVGKDDGDNGNDDIHAELAEDLGFDAQKRKIQAEDERDYEDDLENGRPLEDECDGEECALGFESEIDQVEPDDDSKFGDGNDIVNARSQVFEAEEETYKSSSKLASMSKSSKDNLKTEVKKGGSRGKLVKKKCDRAIFITVNGLDFEVHFSFKVEEPPILLDEIAWRAADRVLVKSGKMDRCSVIDYNGVPALHTAGVDFRSFWDMEDDIDVRNILSNDIHAMLKTYGVEAARATIIKEVVAVFDSYHITVNIRHLSLIADFMTATGGYRAMSRYGMASSSTSPFSKMTFETATRFIVEGALHGEIDTLESPSARICLGLPVKMGTGSFDLLQNFQV